jgi:hypothetical protein
MIELVVAHFIGDWLLQPRWMGVSKSTRVSSLLAHLALVALPLLVVCFMRGTLLWLPIYLILHGIQDWFIWRLAKRYIPADNWYNDSRFWHTVGFDQCLHYIAMGLLL